MNASVLIPTYRRPADLLRCLVALEKQELPASEVLVVSRIDDRETRDALAKYAPTSPLPLRIVDVTEGGQVAALNAGIDACKTELICITDDDAAPHVDWTKRIVDHFCNDPNIGGVGGRDRLYINGNFISGKKKAVGIVQVTGRVVGNHHFGFGAPRCVDVLKGANMSFRTELAKAVGVERRLKGNGAQVHNDLALSLAVRQKGYKLIYDPQIQVDHFSAMRFDEDSRSAPQLIAHRNASYNLNLILLEYFSSKHAWKVWHWYRLVGTRDAPGLVQVIRWLLAGDLDVIRRWKAVREGADAALRDARQRP